MVYFLFLIFMVLCVLCILYLSTADNRSYWAWKKQLKKVPPEFCSVCCVCDGFIYPGQIIGQTSDNRLVHIHYHDTLKERNVFCEKGVTGLIEIGIWDGKKIDKKLSSIVEIICRTGKTLVISEDRESKVSKVSIRG